MKTFARARLGSTSSITGRGYLSLFSALFSCCGSRQSLRSPDVILQRTKEYNVVGLLDKLIDLEDHYKNKLLSIADGSFDGVNRHRFFGKRKDGSTGSPIKKILMPTSQL